MKNYYKALDHFRKLHRSANNRVQIVKGDGAVWLIDGFIAHKIPESEMELNPALFREFSGPFLEIVAEAEKGSLLRETGIVKKTNSRFLVPFISTGEVSFTIWFDRLLLNTFDSGAVLYGDNPLKAAAVKNHIGTVGIILPVRNTKYDVAPFI